jgi:hypothetical protein
MKRSIFSDLDKLIESAVTNATEREESVQQKQASQVKSAGLSANKDKKKEVDEADEEDKEGSKDKGDSDEESAKKITGSGTEKVQQTQVDKPGTRTSKKLADPPEKVLRNPQFNDIEQKINTLRGASSLRKKPISVSVQEYLKTLTVPEKAALLTYLTNLSQIMAPVKKPDEVNEPSEVGLVTKFKNSKSAEKSQEKEKEEKPKKSSGSNVVVVGED